MSGLLSRVKQTISADLHDIMDQKEQKNPIATLNQYLRECESEVDSVRKLVERQYLLKEEFKREYERTTELAAKRKYQADIASKAGETNLYEFALQEHLTYEEQSNHIKQSLEQSLEQLNDLEQKYEQMKHKLKELQLKRMELMGRENIAKAHFRINKLLDNNTIADKTNASFGMMESYLERLEHQINSDYHRHTIDGKIAQLERKLNLEKKDSKS